jgi:hypothetical protein
MDEDREKIDEVLGIVRCVRCGHRLDNEIECPFCSIVHTKSNSRDVLPKWVYITACFFTSPLSIYFILRSGRLTTLQKVLALSGCLIWPGLYFLGRWF